MTREKRPYLSYLLRLWQVGPVDNTSTSWRGSLESSRTGERIGFDNLDELCDFLQKQQYLSSTLEGERLGGNSLPESEEGSKVDDQQNEKGGEDNEILG